MRISVMNVVALALVTAGCGGNEPTQVPGDTVDAAESEPAVPAPAEPAEVAGAVEEVAMVVAPAVARPAGFAQCAVCHVTEAGQASTLGPNLFGIVGRKAGALEGFTYSAAMKNAGLTWDAAQIDAFITRPQKVVPGTRMAFGGVADAAKRKEIVDYLASLK